MKAEGVFESVFGVSGAIPDGQALQHDLKRASRSYTIQIQIKLR